MAQGFSQSPPPESQLPTGIIERSQAFQWGRATWQSLLLAGIEHSMRLTQAKTRFDLDGQQWFDTGDIATLDERGYMHIQDRAKDLIKSGGEWIVSPCRWLP